MSSAVSYLDASILEVGDVILSRARKLFRAENTVDYYDRESTEDRP